MTDRHIIRPAEASELQATQALTALSFESVRHIYQLLPEANSNRTLNPDSSVVLIAITDGIMSATLRYFIDDDRLHIIGLAVHPEFRRCGLCRALIRNLTEIGKHHHLRALSLSTIKETGNQEVFEKLGFEVLLEYKAENLYSVQGNTLHEVYMERAL